MSEVDTLELAEQVVRELRESGAISVRGGDAGQRRLVVFLYEHAVRGIPAWRAAQTAGFPTGTATDESEIQKRLSAAASKFKDTAAYRRAEEELLGRLSGEKDGQHILTDEQSLQRLSYIAETSTGSERIQALKALREFYKEPSSRETRATMRQIADAMIAPHRPTTLRLLGCIQAVESKRSREADFQNFQLPDDLDAFREYWEANPDVSGFVAALKHSVGMRGPDEQSRPNRENPPPAGNENGRDATEDGGHAGAGNAPVPDGADRRRTVGGVGGDSRTRPAYNPWKA